MLWFALLSLFVFVSANYNISEIPFVIPGADFVGYGFDIRYLATEHAIRFPLVDWTYTNGKTYVYPLNRDDVYLVPDQMYVRTVARTDAESFVFSTLDEFRKTESESHGVKADASGDIDPYEYLPAANRTELFDSWKTKYENITTGTISIIPQTIKYETKSFTLGAEVTNAKSAFSRNESFYVRNRQVNQLYQLFLDKRPLRRALENDMQRLYNEAWTTAQEKYEAFFERYGTHVVVSAMLGGAISLDSIVQKNAIQTIDSGVSNFTQQENSTHINSRNETVSDTLERNNPLCNGTYEGYGYNPFAGRCELLPETWCYNPMDTIDEKFDQPAVVVNPWSPPGPVQPPSRGWVQECVNVENCQGWWIFRRCRTRSVCNWVDLGLYQTPPMNSSLPTSLPVTGCPGCGALFIDTTGLPYNRARIGQYKDFPDPPNPQLISFFIYTANLGADHGLVEIVDTKEKNNDNDDVSFIQFMQRGNQFGLRAFDDYWGTFTKPITFPSFGVWYEIRLVLNYTDESVDLWYKRGADTQWLLGEKGHKFLHADTNEAFRVGRILLHTPFAGIRDYWSGFKFCNPTNGAPYVPLTTHTAVATTTAKFKQVVSGKLDTSFENTYNKFTLYQSNNWKLKGGDSSMVDLLNFKQTTDVFETWKFTIQGNPAPVQFTLKEISQFFPDVTTSYGVSQRELVKNAIQEFLTVETVIDPIIDTKLNDTIIPS